MQENSDAPFAGKAFNRTIRPPSFRAQQEKTLTFKNGQRAKLSQTAVGRSKNGQIVNERFYYNKG